jgi:hypothetical protein
MLLERGAKRAFSIWRRSVRAIAVLFRHRAGSELAVEDRTIRDKVFTDQVVHTTHVKLDRLAARLDKSLGDPIFGHLAICPEDGFAANQTNER